MNGAPENNPSPEAPTFAPPVVMPQPPTIPRPPVEVPPLPRPSPNGTVPGPTPAPKPSPGSEPDPGLIEKAKRWLDSLPFWAKVGLVVVTVVVLVAAYLAATRRKKKKPVPAPPGPPPPTTDKCCVKTFNVPTARSGCVQEPRGNDVKAGERFKMEADFCDGRRPCACRCCEYWQDVRGSFTINGFLVEHLLPNPAGPSYPPIPMQPRPPAGSRNDDFIEDGFVDPPAGINVHYGHRDEGEADPSDRYFPNRQTGCRYRGSDFPGVEGAPGITYVIDLDFQGRVVDTCQSRVVQITHWTVTCQGTL